MFTSTYNGGSQSVDQRPPRGTEAATQRLLVTPEVAAELLSLGRTKVYDLMSSGKLRSVKIGRARRVSTDALSEYVASLTGDSPWERVLVDA